MTRYVPRDVRVVPTRFDQIQEVIHPGEYYRVNCPFCGDRRYRLWFNHLWGTKQSGTFMAICYNEDCLSVEKNREELISRLTDFTSSGLTEFSSTIVKPGRLAEDVKELRPPGDVTRLDKLPENHSARMYLQRRGFDPDKLAKEYDVSYCEDSEFWLAKHRIIIPYYEGRELLGWQARYVGELNWGNPDAPPKAWTAYGTQRQSLLYGHQRAIQHRTVVLVEGPADAWAVGHRAVAAWGMPTVRQCLRLCELASRSEHLVLLLDPDVRTKEQSLRTYEKRRDLLKNQFPGKTVEVWLPDGTDPGQFDEEFLWEYVVREARKSNVNLSPKKLPPR